MSRARELSRLGNPNIISADSAGNVGFGTVAPKEKVNVVGVVSATQFFGDGSGLDGIASAGIGTALSEDKTKALNTIYYTNDEVVVTNNSTVNPPASGYIAYTQQPTVVVADTVELTVSDGDDLLVDVLGIATGTNVDYAARGNGVFDNIYVDNIESSGGQTSVNFPKGLVSTGVATFHSDVSIGGTLTYEDVKNVDSVGLITARTGIKVTAGGVDIAGGGIDVVGDIGLGAGKQTGSAGQLLTSGGSGANATWTTVDAAPSVSGIASASINNGAPVCMYDDGKLGAVTGTAGYRASTTPFITEHSAGAPELNDLVYDTVNDQYISVYHGTGSGSNRIHAKVGTVSGTTITWGAEQTIVSAGNPDQPDALWDTVNNKLIVLYRNAADSSKGYCAVCAVSGTTITGGTPVAVTSGTINRFCMTQDTVEDKIIVFWENGSNVGKAIVGEINAAGNTSSWAGETQYCPSRCFSPNAAFWPGQNKVVCSFQHYSNAEQGAIIAGTVSGNTITFGTLQYYETQYQVNSSLAYDSDNAKMLISWVNGSNGSYYPKVCSSTLSGTVFTFGTNLTVKGIGGTAAAGDMPNLCYDPNSKKSLFIWKDANTGSPRQWVSTVLTLDGNTITQTTPYQVTTSQTPQPSGDDTGKIIALDPDNNLITLQYKDATTGDAGLRYYVERIGSSNMTATNFVGLSQAAYTNGQTAKVSVVGSTSTNQTGLTTATKYFVSGDGTLSTTAGDPSVDAGFALSFTSLLIR